MNIKEQIITICQGELEGKELIQSIESLVSLLTPFNHEAEFEFDAWNVDVAVAGRFAGSDALAAVGSNAAVVALFVNVFVGLSVGVNVLVAIQFLLKF